MALGLPYGVVPYGGLYPAGLEPPLGATVVTIGFSVGIEAVEPLETALGGDLNKAEFAAVLRPWYLGDSD